MSDYLSGKVYILLNEEVNCVKVGLTSSDVEDRLIDINRKWRGKNATCQVCGGRRLVDRRGRIPKHVLSGAPCPGGLFLPLEKESELALSYLKMLKDQHDSLKGSEKGSNTRRINTLEERILRYQSLGKAAGRWRVDTVYYTSSAEEVELKSHKVLARYLDKSMPFGEVFSCTVAEARGAIESTLKKLGLLETADKVIHENNTLS